METRKHRRWPRVLAVGTALWWVGVTWGVPLLIRSTHSGRLPFLSQLMPGRLGTPVASYLDMWEPIARASVVMVLTAAILIGMTLWFRQYAAARRHDPTPHSPPPAGMGGLFLIAAFLGLVTGVGEAYYATLRAFYLRKPVHDLFEVSQHAVWMTPLANLIAFTLVGILLALIWRIARGRIQHQSIVVVLIWLGLFVLSMTTGRLHWVAAVLVSAGVAVHVGSVLTPGAGELVRLARNSIGWIAALVAALGMCVPGLENLRERRQIAEAGQPPPGAPNILLIVMDTERAASTSLHGAELPTTPFLERFAAEGVSFHWGLSPASWTLPSHEALFTGLRAFEVESRDRPLDDRFHTLAEVLARSGYVTAGFVANQFFLNDITGLDRGFGRWEDQAILPGQVLAQAWLTRNVVSGLKRRVGIHQGLARKIARDVNDSFIGWVDSIDEGRPFFAFLNYFDPHALSPTQASQPPVFNHPASVLARWPRRLELHSGRNL